MSEQLEQTILGAALNSDSSAQLVTAKLSPQDFYYPRNEMIFTALADAILKDEPTDAVTIASKIDHDRTGGAPYLFQLIEVACLPAHVEHHIQTLKTASAKRRLGSAGLAIQQLSEAEDLEQALNEAQAYLDGVIDADSDEAKRVAETIDATLDRFVEIQDGTAPKGLMTGFYDLDEITSGLQPGQMVIIAARPGCGKSTLAVDIMRHLSIHEGIPTAIFSLEMSTHEINTRVLASEANVDIKRMRQGRMRSEDWDRVGKARESLDAAPLFIDESPENTVMDIVAKTKMMVKRHGIKLIVVDYLQLLHSGKREESRQQEVAGFSRALKLLAKSAGIPVIAVAQLNRESERNDSKPKPSDLRESGALEQDADVILLLHREDMKHSDGERAGEVDVIVAKNRGGETGTATLVNQLHYGKFGNFKRDFA